MTFYALRDSRGVDRPRIFGFIRLRVAVGIDYCWIRFFASKSRCLSFAEDWTIFSNGKAKHIVLIDLNYPNDFVRNCKLPLLLLVNTKQMVQ